MGCPRSVAGLKVSWVNRAVQEEEEKEEEEL